jgi:tetratricopeptide (TPR) repeat protein
MLKKFFLALAVSAALGAPFAWAASGGSEILAGNEAAALENYEQAIIHFTRAISAGNMDNEQLAVAYNNRGSAYDDWGKTGPALQDFDQAIKLDPRFDAPYFNRSFIYERQINYAKAIADMEKAVSLTPDDDGFKLRLEWLRDQRR